MKTAAQFPTLTADIITRRLRAARLHRTARRGVIAAQIATARANTAARAQAALPLFSK